MQGPRLQVPHDLGARIPKSFQQSSREWSENDWVLRWDWLCFRWGDNPLKQRNSLKRSSAEHCSIQKERTRLICIEPLASNKQWRGPRGQIPNPCREEEQSIGSSSRPKNSSIAIDPIIQHAHFGLHVSLKVWFKSEWEQSGELETLTYRTVCQLALSQ